MFFVEANTQESGGTQGTESPSDHLTDQIDHPLLTPTRDPDRRLATGEWQDLGAAWMLDGPECGGKPIRSRGCLSDGEEAEIEVAPAVVIVTSRRQAILHEPGGKLQPGSVGRLGAAARRGPSAAAAPFFCVFAQGNRVIRPSPHSLR
ncbi:MAG: hypothetical protein ABIJ48_03425 [Actinomycetota bacterium]